MECRVIKKDRTAEEFDFAKIKNAVTKSAERIAETLSESDLAELKKIVLAHLTAFTAVEDLHNVVEKALTQVNDKVAESYRNYRNYKKDFGYALMGDIEEQIQKTLTEVDRENSNSNTRYISTKRTEVAQIFSKEMYQKMFLDVDVLQAMKDGYIYVHDLKDMLLPQFNCCLTDVASILKGGFELEGIKYTEPKDIRTAVGQVGDIIMIISAQHYGGNTTPQIDKVLAPYYKKTIEKYFDRNVERGMDFTNASSFALIDAYNDLKQSLQGLEIKLNTVVSARGAYPFTTFTFGDVDNAYESDVARAILEVRLEGHGEQGKKKNLIFPKLVFLYNKEIHDKKAKYEALFKIAVKCSSKCMYPDYLGEAHKREGKWVSPMGCRAFLSNYRDEESGELVFEGRFNIGAVSLNLPMIFKKAETEEKDFFAELDYYLALIRKLLKNRYDYLAKAQASSNPLMFTQGGAYGGHLKPDERIAPLLKSATASFGITALHELSLLATSKSLREDNTFALAVMNHINDRVEAYKKEDGHLYAIYNTPAESLCGTQLKQFRSKYGVIKGVSDKEYFTNSNHLWVAEDVSMFEKQDKEIELFQKSAGGHIGYVRVTNPDNLEGLGAVIRRGLDMGFYQGVNFNACTCEDCGHQGNDFAEKCPVCGSESIDEINRITGYLGFKRKRGDRTVNDAMLASMKDRRSM